MKELENVVVGAGSIPSLVITIVFMIAIPVFSLVFWRRKHTTQTNFSYLIAGALGFLVSARVLELGVHYFCILADNPVSRFITGSTMTTVTSVTSVTYGVVRKNYIIGMAHLVDVRVAELDP